MLAGGTVVGRFPGLGPDGRGNVKSAKSVFLQNGRICSYKYHCHSKSNPLIGVSCGSLAVITCWWSTLRRFNTIPSLAASKRNLWYFRRLGIGLKNC